MSKASRPTIARCAAAALALGVLGRSAPARATNACGPVPVMLVVQDRSYSMTYPPDSSCFGCETKWSIASRVVPSVVNHFQDELQFALMMFAGPNGTSCTPGQVVLGLGATSQQVAQEFQTIQPTSDTPTGETLEAAKSYLTGLHLSVPAYVLLITDGNPTVCSSASAFDAKGYAAQAAGDLYSAGFPVYVVGFGDATTGSTVTYDKQTLDAIASSGGTGQSYSATNESLLDSSLTQIITGVSCCHDVCGTGSTQCDPGGGGLQTCAMQPDGCTDWSAPVGCGPGASCTGGACQCDGACSPGVSQCGAGGSTQTCQTASNGCTHWVSTACSSGQKCAGGACQSCVTCAAGTAQCQGTTPQTCVADASGCTSWQSGPPCGSGAVCDQGSCVSCSAPCTLGNVQCSGTAVQTCVAGPLGCNVWQTSSDCVPGVCVQGACCPCAAGQTQCGADGLETCTASASGGCPSWTSAACGSNELCIGGTCASQCDPRSEVSNCPAGTRCTAQDGGGSYCAPIPGVDGGAATSGGTGSSGSTGSSSGTGGTSGTTGGDVTRQAAGMGGSTGSTSGKPKVAVSGGCGCDTGKGGSTAALALWLVFGAWAGGRRRAPG